MDEGEKNFFTLYILLNYRYFAYMEILNTDSILNFTLSTAPYEEQSKIQQKAIQYKASSLASGFQVSQYYFRFITLEKSYCIMLVIQTLLSVLYYELDYEGENNDTYLILCLMLALAVATVMFSMMSLGSFNEWKKAQLKSYQTRQKKSLIFDWLIILVQPYSFLENKSMWNWDYTTNTYMEFKLNFFFVILSLLKLCLIVPCMMNLLKFKNPRSSRVCKMYGCENSKIFQLKCFFKEDPIKLVSSMFLVLILFFSFAYRVSERNRYANKNTFEYYANCVWMVIITMTSVGFGDLTPVTSIGRSIGFACTFCGVMTVSIMVLVVINTFQMNYREGNALKILKKLQTKKELKKVAGQYAKLSLWRLWTNHKLKRNNCKGPLLAQSQNQKKKRHQFRQLLRIAKYSDTNLADLSVEMSRLFENASINIQNLNENCDTLIKLLSHQYLLNIDELKNHQN